MAKKTQLEDLLDVNSVLDVYHMVLDGRLNRFPNGFWTRSEGKARQVECIKYMIEVLEKIDVANIPKQLTIEVFKKNKLGGIVPNGDRGLVSLIVGLYPGKFNRNEFLKPRIGSRTKLANNIDRELEVRELDGNIIQYKLKLSGLDILVGGRIEFNKDLSLLGGNSYMTITMKDGNKVYEARLKIIDNHLVLDGIESTFKFYRLDENDVVTFKYNKIKKEMLFTDLHRIL